MINTKPNITLQHIEDLYVKLYSQVKNEYVDLKISMNMTFSSFAVFTAFVQLIVTWRRLPNCGKLILERKNGEIHDEDLEIITKKYYGFLASILSWENGVINTNGKSLKTRIKPFNTKFKEFFQHNEFNNIARGDTILIPFFDHVPPSEGLFPILYKNQNLKDEKEFNKLTNILIANAAKNSAYTTPNLKKISEDINSILYELFDNTHKWARKSYTGSDLRPSTRGVLSKFFKFDRNRITTYSGESKGLSKYFNHVVKIFNNTLTNKFIVFIEISIFDSGSGLSQVYSQRSLDSMTLKDEYDYLLECLKKNNTSHKPIAENLLHGSGLHKIMKLLDSRKGFLRIRSGRMNLYRDFFSVPFYPSREDDRFANYVLLDWKNDSTKIYNWEKAEGTSITMIIPTMIQAEK